MGGMGSRGILSIPYSQRKGGQDQPFWPLQSHYAEGVESNSGDCPSQTFSQVGCLWTLFCGHSDLSFTLITSYSGKDMVKEWSWYLEPSQDIWAI